MTGPTTELRQALQASPDNTLLRVMLVRALVDQGETAEALTTAMQLVPEDVSSAADRAVLAGLWQQAGLMDRAKAWGADAETAPEVPQPVAPAPEAAPEAVSQTAPNPLHMPKAGLRVVGGSEAGAPDPEGSETAVQTFADIGGLEEVKRDIRRRIILPFAQPNLVARFRKKAGGGVLLYGPPGCGKTLLARGTAGECGAQFLHAELSDILQYEQGATQRRLSALFNKARENRPTVLFFDEIEALASKRSHATASHVAQMVSHFLQEMDGFASDNTGVLVLAATNTPWALDPAFLRPGRFDRLFFVPPPDLVARRQIPEMEMGDRPMAPTVDLDAIAKRTSGASGADLRAVVDIATDQAIDLTLDSGAEAAIDQTMLLSAAQTHKSAVGDWLATAKDYATYANESGRYDDVLAFLNKWGRAS